MTTSTRATAMNPRFITSGMYAFSDDLRNAWRALFNEFLTRYKPAFPCHNELRFGADAETLRSPQLFIGHTCGYPLMTEFKDTLTPICVPVFDVPGYDTRAYSSLFIVPLNSSYTALQDCSQRTAVINSYNSNSGMNVLRHAIAPMSQGSTFFSSVIVSGSHKQSLVEVSEGRADIAAIDCVSFALTKDHWPNLAAKVRCIGYSKKTTGLPFVVPTTLCERIDQKQLIDSLNQATNNLSEHFRAALHLQHFAPVKLDDYQSIINIELAARGENYPLLR